MLTLQEPPNYFTKRFSVMDCIIIKKNHEVPERLTGRKINLTVFKRLILWWVWCIMLFYYYYSPNTIHEMISYV
jgi:hypothetical protein